MQTPSILEMSINIFHDNNLRLLFMLLLSTQTNICNDPLMGNKAGLMFSMNSNSTHDWIIKSHWQRGIRTMTEEINDMYVVYMAANITSTRHKMIAYPTYCRVNRVLLRMSYGVCYCTGVITCFQSSHLQTPWATNRLVPQDPLGRKMM